MKNKIFVRKTLILFCSIVFTFFILLTVLIVYQTKPMTGDKNIYTVQVAIPEGMTIKMTSNLLYEKKLIHSSFLFYTFARLGLFDINGYKIKKGIYEIRSNMSLWELAKLLESGKQMYLKMVIPEGLTIEKIADRLEQAQICKKNDFLISAHNKTLLSEYGIEEDSFEGYLFPDTYFFTPWMSSDSVIRKFVNTFFSKIAEIPSLKNCSKAKLHDTVILASIVEREYRVDSEAPLIASVFTNRLQKNIGLYSCATIEYIITEIEGKPHPDVIKYQDLDIDNPYNTYKWRGLPPGPISNPGLVALKAAADPPVTPYYYFRLTNLKEGTHSFTTTFSQHTETGRLYTKGVIEK